MSKQVPVLPNPTIAPIQTVKATPMKKGANKMAGESHE